MLDDDVDTKTWKGEYWDINKEKYKNPDKMISRVWTLSIYKDHLTLIILIHSLGGSLRRKNRISDKTNQIMSVGYK